MNVLNKQKQEEILTLIIAGHSFRKIAPRWANGIRFCRRFFHIFLTPSNILS